MAKIMTTRSTRVFAIIMLLLILPCQAFAAEAWKGVYGGIALQKQIQGYSEQVISVNRISRDSWDKDIQTLSKPEYSDYGQNPLKLFVQILSLPFDSDDKLKYLITMTTEYPNSMLAKDALLQMVYYYEYRYLRTKNSDDYNKASMYLAKIANSYGNDYNMLRVQYPEFANSYLLNAAALDYLYAGNILGKYARSKQDKGVGKNAIALYLNLAHNIQLSQKPDNYGTPFGLLALIEGIKVAMVAGNPASMVTELKNYPDIQVKSGNSLIHAHAWATVQLADYAYQTGDSTTAYRMYQEISRTMGGITETNTVTKAELNYGDHALKRIQEIAKGGNDIAASSIDMSNDTPNETDLFPAEAAFSSGDYQKAMGIYKQLIIKYQKLEDYEARDGQWRETLIATARNGYITAGEQLGKSKPELFNAIVTFAPAQDYMVRYLAIEYLLQAGDNEQAYKVSKKFIEKYKNKPHELGSVYLSMETPIAKVEKIFTKLDFERLKD